jgi:hypothetical protein
LQSPQEEALVQELFLSPESAATELPDEVYNDAQIYFPPIFNQSGASCVQAAEIGYCFTYEINRVRNLQAGNWTDNKENCYHHLYTYNFLNGGSGASFTYYMSGFKIIQENGCPTYNIYDDPALYGASRYKYWMTDYSKYYSGMQNRITSYKDIFFNASTTSLETLKHWIADHNKSSETGGLAIIAILTGNSQTGYWNVNNQLPSGTPHETEYLVTQWGTDINTGHALTLVGYDDNVKYDFNGDGQYTDTLDLNGDNIINLLDSEFGAFKAANSWGQTWGNDGFIWIPYKMIADGLQREGKAYVCVAEETYEPLLSINTSIDYPCREKLKLQVGYGVLANQTNPTDYTPYKSFRNQGGCNTMRGAYTGAIEIGLNFGYWYQNNDFGKIFFMVDEYADPNNSYTGTINDYSFIDRRWGEVFELNCNQTQVQIANGVRTTLSIEYDLLPHHDDLIDDDLIVSSNMVSRFTPTVTNGAKLELLSGVKIDMYNSELVIDQGAILKVGNNVVFKGKRGINKITIRGNAEFGTNVQFIAEEGAQLYLNFENSSSAITFNDGYFERTNLFISCQNLTIEGSTVLCDGDNRIFVNRGSKFEIDNSTLSNFNGELWKGIEVWGNSNISQIPTTNQGHVQIFNGSIIENSECGIRTWKPYALPDGSESLDPDKDYFGGLVWANGAIFRNNKTAVEFMPYELRNYSYLTQCSFETTAALPGGTLPDYFVKLDGVTAISITGNDFKNTYTGYASIFERGGGIYSFDSDVLVDRVCTGQVMPCNEYKESTFSGLFRGIYALGADIPRTVRIQGSELSNTVRGIYLSSLDFANVNLNHFQAWNEDAIGQVPIGYSLYLDACTGFTIEENQFINIESSRRGIGLIVNESGADNNQIYNNYFAKLNYGTIAQGYNRSGGSTTTGLCYKCNDFVNNDYDIKIVPRNPGWSTTYDGIAYYQGKNDPGNHLAPAGNTFTTVTNIRDIGNTCNWIVYYRHQTGPASTFPSPADMTTIYQVGGTTYTKSVSCPSHLGTGTEKEEVKAALESATAEAEATQVALISLVDGGSTPELQTEVITSIPEEGMELRDQLLTESPYLSETVLETSILKEDVLNNAMIRDVMVANPQSAKSAQMVEMLDERVNPMTDEMKNEILSGQIITSEKEDLEAVLSFMKQEAWYNFGALCRLYAIDTLHTWSSDTIGVLFANETSLESQYKLAFWHLFKGNTSSATQVLSSIPAMFTLDASELAQQERYSLLLNTLIQLSNDPEVVLEAGTDVANTLTQLNTMSEDKPAAMSRNLLIAAGLMSYDEPIKLDDVLKTMPVYNPSIKGNESSKLRVYPNPANDFITIAWNTPDNSNLLLTLTDANGRTVHKQKLNGQNNETILNVSGFVTGTYRLSLSEGKKTFATETVVIQSKLN